MVSRARRLASVFCTAILAGCALLPSAAPPVSPTPSPAQTRGTARPSATHSPAPSATIPAGPTARPSATLAPGEPPRVEGALWVANEADGNLLVIDTADNSVAVIVPTNLNPRWVVNDSRWVWALDPNHDALIQVDPRAHVVERVINFPERDVSALAVGAEAVWVAYTDRVSLQFLLPQEEYVPTGGVLRLDFLSGEITGSADTVSDRSIIPDRAGLPLGSGARPGRHAPAAHRSADPRPAAAGAGRRLGARRRVCPHRRRPVAFLHRFWPPVPHRARRAPVQRDRAGTAQARPARPPCWPYRGMSGWPRPGRPCCVSIPASAS